MEEPMTCMGCTYPLQLQSTRMMSLNPFKVSFFLSFFFFVISFRRILLLLFLFRRRCRRREVTV